MICLSQGGLRSPSDLSSFAWKGIGHSNDTVIPLSHTIFHLIWFIYYSDIVYQYTAISFTEENIPVQPIKGLFVWGKFNYSQICGILRQAVSLVNYREKINTRLDIWNGGLLTQVVFKHRWS